MNLPPSYMKNLYSERSEWHSESGNVNKPLDLTEHGTINVYRKCKTADNLKSVHVESE